MKRHLIRTGTSGGIGYHLRAFRYGSTLWASFREQTRHWVDIWSSSLPAESRIVLMGPSAGHTLPLSSLGERPVSIVDPDPLGRLLLQWRLSQVRKRSTPRARLRPELLTWMEESHWEPFFKNLGQSPTLWCNLLGQIPDISYGGEVGSRERLERMEKVYPAFFAEALARHLPWASFHDRLSFQVPERVVPDSLALALCRALHQLGPRFRPDEELTEILGIHLPALQEVTTHQTSKFFPESLDRQYTLWQLTPKDWHVIEWVSFPYREGS